jgi:plastocyanin
MDQGDPECLLPREPFTMATMRKPRYILIGSAIGLALVLAACSGDGGSSAAAQEPVATSQISVQDNNFEPEVAEVTAADTVTWTWEGSSEHNVVGDGFESDVQRDGTFERRFDEPGTYEYRCTLHGGMTGTVIVTDASGASGSEAQ